MSVSIYVAMVLAVAIVCVLKAKETANTDIDEVAASRAP